MYWPVKQLRTLLAFMNGCLPKRFIEFMPEVIMTTTICICTQRYIARAQ